MPLVNIGLGGAASPSAQPVITGINPDGNVPINTSETLTLTGSGFTGATLVTIGGQSYPFTVVDDNTVTVNYAAGNSSTAGVPKDVAIIGPGGNGLLPGGVVDTCVLPSLTSILPTGADQGDGTITVAVTGTDFDALTTFQFTDGVNTLIISSAVINTAIQATLDVEVPSGAVLGAYDLVATVGGCGSDTLAGAFTVAQPVPVITSITPDNQVPINSSETLTLNGLYFTGATDVSIGGTSYPFTVIDDTTITVDYTAGDSSTLGFHDVVITNGTGPGTLPNGVENICGDAVTTSISPSTIDTSATVNITATGSGYDALIGVADIVVTDGVTPLVVSNVVYVGANQVTFDVTSTAVEDDFEVTISNPGCGGNPLTDALTVAAAVVPPDITSISPDGQVPINSSETLNLNGSGFTGVTTVTIGGVVYPFTFVNDNTVTVNYTAGDSTTVGFYDVVLTTGAGSDTLPNGVENTCVLPDITGSIPASALQGSGTTTLTLSGTEFDAQMTVSITDGVNTLTTSNLNVTPFTSATVDVSVPAGAIANDYDIVVTVPGCGSDTLIDSFTVQPAPPVIASISPDGQVPINTAETLTLNGSFFMGASSVTIAGNAYPFTVVDDNTITVNYTAGNSSTLGFHDVVVTGPGGNDTLANGVENICGDATTTTITPAVIAQNTNAAFVADGADFDPLIGPADIVITNGSETLAISNVLWVNSGQITFEITTTAVQMVGTDYDVTISNPGCSGNTLVDAFEVTGVVCTMAPMFTSLVPDVLIPGVNTTVVLTGTQLYEPTVGAFFAAAGITVVSADYTNAPTQVTLVLQA